MSTIMYTGFDNDTICAVSTPSGVGGIAVIRVSGPEAIAVADKIWAGKPLKSVASHTVHLGDITEKGSGDEPLDKAVATVFRGPNSFTGEDVVEFSVHGSKWIQRELVNLLIRSGCRLAEPGEFTRRAFASGKLDLAQAEAVADVIASSSRSAHRLASSQMRGVFSRNISSLRDELIRIASLLELELDFSEEEVEFASRKELSDMAHKLLNKISGLVRSFSTGNALKEGVPVAIVGEPNVGKSTLLNQLLNDNRAIVSDIPGTTRDTIEDTMEIDGVLYRFIDTAGIRETSDRVESMGIERTLNTVGKARIVVWLISPDVLKSQFEQLAGDILRHLPTDAKMIVAVNKIDRIVGDEERAAFEVEMRRMVADGVEKARRNLVGETSCGMNYERGDSEGGYDGESSRERYDSEASRVVYDTEGVLSDGTKVASVSDRVEVSHNGIEVDVVFISAAGGVNIDELRGLLKKCSGAEDDQEGDMMVTNARHYEALVHAKESLERVIDGINAGISGDFIAQDLRETIYYIGTITGSITTSDLLQSIFEKFCIGK